MFEVSSLDTLCAAFSLRISRSILTGPACANQSRSPSSESRFPTCVFLSMSSIVLCRPPMHVPCIPCRRCHPHEGVRPHSFRPAASPSWCCDKVHDVIYSGCTQRSCESPLARLLHRVFDAHIGVRFANGCNHAVFRSNVLSRSTAGESKSSEEPSPALRGC